MELVNISVGELGFKDVTQKEIDDKKSALEGKFHSEDYNNSKSEVICPKCFHQFTVR